MSKYSLDSLDNIEGDSLEKSILMNNDKNENDNIIAIKSSSADTFVKDVSFHINPILMTLHKRHNDIEIKDNTTESNGTVRGDRYARITGGRNSITTSGRRFVRRRQESNATWNESRLRIRKGNNVVEKGEKEKDDANRRCCHMSTERCSPEAQNSSSKCNLRSNGSNAKIDKKLGIQRRPRIRSPEDSTLSICGDSQPRELSLDEGCSSLPGTSRDDSSELSFYRRFIEGHVTRTHSTRSCEIPHRGIRSFPGEQCEHSGSDKSKKPGYRPYTIEEYRSLSMPRPDRSLGPDKDEIQAKREWLMRRRSYGDSVSARNREQILQRTRRLKDRENSSIPETDCAMQESVLKCLVRYPKGKEIITVPSKTSPSQEVEILEKTPNFSSSLASYNVLEDSYLETLQQRHLQEKKLADRLMRQALNSGSPLIQLGCRPWNLSLTSVIILALSNMLLTFLLLQSETCMPETIPRKVMEVSAVTEWNLGTLVKQQEQQPECITQDYQPTSPDSNSLQLDIKLGRWDSRRIFRTFDSVLVGSKFTELSQTYRVCLATQTSVEKLHSLVQVALHWTGPMSVALYAAGDEEFEVLQRYLVYLRKCYESIRERVIFSLAVPRMRPPKKQPRVFELPDIIDCAKPEATLNEFASHISSEQTNWRIRNVYPQNHMRNLARKNCQTDYVFLTDVDIIPSFNLSVALDEFLRNDNCDKCAYVIPTYELDTRMRFPQNKTELIRLARKGLARPFHQKVFIHNQFATNFTRWLQDVSPTHKYHENVRTGKVYVSHDVTNFEFLYEPFYVAKDIAPSHDERFMGYGYTRNTQVYEMYVTGYQFKVLSPVFTGHWGLQTRKSRPAWRERQNSANRKQFETFKKEVFARYMRDPLKMMKNAN